MNANKLEILVVARAFTLSKRTLPRDFVAKLARFMPGRMTEPQFREAVESAIADLQKREILDANLCLHESGELARRIGKHAAKTWQQLAELVLPALAVGIAADDGKSHARIRKNKDGWAAAIAGRALGIWIDGPPPSLTAVCDALAWRELGLPGKPKQCPDEIRAHFIRLRIGSDPASAQRQVRLLATNEVGALRPAPKALRDALVRGWLEDKRIGAPTSAAEQRTLEPAAVTTPPDGGPRSFTSDVRAIARAAREGVFGDRNVFISTVWDQLRQQPAWAKLDVDDFKARLVSAHREGELRLARADYVAAMDPQLVASSETLTDGAEFHFIVREEAV